MEGFDLLCWFDLLAYTYNIYLIVIFAFIAQCLQCIAKTKGLALLFWYFLKGVVDGNPALAHCVLEVLNKLGSEVSSMVRQNHLITLTGHINRPSGHK